MALWTFARILTYSDGFSTSSLLLAFRCPAFLVATAIVSSGVSRRPGPAGMMKGMDVVGMKYIRKPCMQKRSRTLRFGPSLVSTISVC